MRRIIKIKGNSDEPLNLNPELPGLKFKQKVFDETYDHRIRYKNVEYDDEFITMLKDCASVKEKLKVLYRRFSEFESQDKQSNQGYSIRPHRFFIGEGEHKYNGVLRNWITYSEHIRALFIQNEIKLNILSYHPAFVKLDRIEFEDIPDFKKYVQTLETTDWKSKYIRANNNGFITYKDYVIIWNKFGEKKNGNALISKLIFTDK
jgi:hypothetical protein